MSGVADNDKGFKALMQRITSEKWRVTVGVHGAQGSASSRSGEGLTVGDVATIAEYGLGYSPERSWLRGWADQQKAQNTIKLRTIAEQVFKGAYDVKTGLERLGLVFVGEIQVRISSGIPPANAAETVAAKGSSTPLINTGQFRSSITHQVKKGDE